MQPRPGGRYLVGPGSPRVTLEVEGGGDRVGRRPERGDDGAVRGGWALGLGSQAVVCGDDRRDNVGIGTRR